MVGITINLNDDIHNKLKNRASNNMRSMKNELIMIIKNSLEETETEQNLNNSEINKQNNFLDEAEIINSI